MPRPANPDWRPKTVTLSNEVIEAVWVKAAREGKTPGRVINEILNSVLLTAIKAPEQPSSASPAEAIPDVPDVASDLPSHPGEPESTNSEQDTTNPLEPQIDAPPQSTENVATEPRLSVLPQSEQIAPEQVSLIQMLQEPRKFRLGSRNAFFQELSKRCGEEVSFYEFHHWREQSRIPDHLLPHVQALIDEKRQPKIFKRT